MLSHSNLRREASLITKTDSYKTLPNTQLNTQLTLGNGNMLPDEENPYNSQVGAVDKSHGRLEVLAEAASQLPHLPVGTSHLQVLAVVASHLTRLPIIDTSRLDVLAEAASQLPRLHEPRADGLLLLLEAAEMVLGLLDDDDGEEKEEQRHDSCLVIGQECDRQGR